MDQDWSFWMAQLSGSEPETTPGTPHAGFYRGGSSGAAYKRAFPETLIAIWQEDGEWVARTDRAGAQPIIQRGWRVDEFVFPRCCRNAITHETYIEKIKEIEDARTGSAQREVQSPD